MSVTVENPTGTELAPVPETSVNIYTPKRPLVSKVLEKYRITHHTSPNYAWHVVLSLEGSEMAGRYRIGQSIGVVPEGRFVDEKFNYAHQKLDTKIRLYSLASACWGDDWKGQTVSLCVKREFSEDETTGEIAFGECSNHICDAKPGDELQITGPSGKGFMLPDNALEHDYVLVATGTGIAPFRGMLIELFNQGYEGQVWLVFGTPYSTDIMYDDEFRFLDERHSNLRYVTAVSREQKNPRGGKMYAQDRLVEHQDELAPLLEKPETMLYMCGLKGVEFGVYQWLHGIGSNLVTLPEGMTVEEIQNLRRGDPAWIKVDRARDKTRLFKETY